MKRIGIGLSDFKHLIEEDFYYYDKTLLSNTLAKLIRLAGERNTC